MGVDFFFVADLEGNLRFKFPFYSLAAASLGYTPKPVARDFWQAGQWLILRVRATVMSA